MIFNHNFNEKELEYINASIDDQSQDIHREYIKSTTYINCKLPKGHYLMKFRSTKDTKKAHGDLLVKGLKASINRNIVCFYLDEPTNFYFSLTSGGNEEIITELRKFAVLNKRTLQAENERLIAKDIKSHTNLGAEYNRTSFYDTIDECLMDGEDLIIDKTKSLDDYDVKYLRYMYLEQLGSKLYKEDNNLNTI